MTVAVILRKRIWALDQADKDIWLVSESILKRVKAE
jgi:hypothetical protein